MLLCLQALAAIRLEIFPPKGAWSYKLRWNRNKKDLGQLWSKIENRIAKTLPANDSKKSEVVFSSLDGSSRVEDEDDLLTLMENAIDDGEDTIKLRAINVEVQIEQFRNPTQTDTDL